MNVRYLFASPDGDIPADETLLDRPFRLSPSEEHPTLILRDYFETLERFLLHEGSPSSPSTLQGVLGLNSPGDEILEILIRTEKHGALYHIASVEILLPGRRRKFALVSALSGPAKATLNREFETLRRLHGTFSLPYVPEVYIKNECPLPGKGNPETLVTVLQEWFEGYYEWHFSGREGGHSSRLCIWDLEKGDRPASEREKREIFRQAPRILTLYYDPGTSNRIHPWHHAAGDFIVKSGPEGKIDVRLTTVRNYGPMFDFSDKAMNPWTGLIFFFIDLVTRMRIDRLDGVGEPVWAGNFALDAALQGFFEGLTAMAQENRLHPGSPREVLALLKAFSEEELLNLMTSLLEDYKATDSLEVPIILTHLKDHVARLNRSIRHFQLGSPPGGS